MTLATVSANEQLPLKLKVALPRGLASIWCGENHATIEALEALAAGTVRGQFVLMGPEGSGKTSLLHALVDDAVEAANMVAAASARAIGSQLVAWSQGIALLALDDVDQLAGDEVLERALFALLNARHDQRLVTMLACSVEPEFTLRDLRSRFHASTRLIVLPLGADAAFEAFAERAQALGIALSAPVRAYLRPRVARNLPALLALLAQIDEHTLSVQRKVSVPLLKALLQER